MSRDLKACKREIYQSPACIYTIGIGPGVEHTVLDRVVAEGLEARDAGGEPGTNDDISIRNDEFDVKQ